MPAASARPRRTFSSSAEGTFATGYNPEYAAIPKRFLEITTGRGPMDAEYPAGLKEQYAKVIRDLATEAPKGS